MVIDRNIDYKSVIKSDCRQLSFSSTVKLRNNIALLYNYAIVYDNKNIIQVIIYFNQYDNNT